MNRIPRIRRAAEVTGRENESMPSGDFRHQALTRLIIGCAFDVINELGAGIIESVYERAMLVALGQVGVRVRRQQSIPVSFRGELVGEFYADLLVDEQVIVELKAIKRLAPENVSQVINYLHATGIEVGLLINFGNPRLEYRRVTRTPHDRTPPA